MSINIVRTGRKGFQKVSRRLKRIEGKLDTMSTKTDQTITILTDVSTKVTDFVTAQGIKYDDLKKAFDLLGQQNTLLQSEDDTDKAKAVALQGDLDAANAQAVASAAADDTNEQKVLDAAAGLQTFANTLGGTPDTPAGNTVPPDGSTPTVDPTTIPAPADPGTVTATL
jgi:hypothetical protein